MVGTNQGFSGCSRQKSLDRTKQTSKEISKVSCYLNSGLFTYKEEMLLFMDFFSIEGRDYERFITKR
jgi:hypothetical protein